jgi:L-alanine-DL-glutamate epimerase-like enolase superfamily enzyme
VLKVSSRILKLHPRNVFRISRMEEKEVVNVILQIEDGSGHVGTGEASPNPFYRETTSDVDRRLQSLQGFLANRRIESVDDISSLWTEAWPILSPSRAAQCALDIALWDLVARKRGMTVSELAHGVAPGPVTSCCTIGISTPEELPAKVEELRQNPIIKVKCDQRADLEPLRFIRSQTSARLIVDANCAWGGVDVKSLSPQLKDLGVVLIEQPLPPQESARMPDFLGNSCIPVVADESCVEERDVSRMPGCFSGFNIKLVKCGGLTPALRMLREGRELGLKVMVGCMLETSVLIAAGAVIGQKTDFADLDGSWLLRDDPFVGLNFERGILTPSSEPGLGIALPT